MIRDNPSKYTCAVNISIAEYKEDDMDANDSILAHLIQIDTATQI
jgi:hypothetical protein